MDLDRGKKVPPSPPPDGYNWGKEDRLAIDSVIGGGLKTPGVCWSLEHPSENAGEYTRKSQETPAKASTMNTKRMERMINAVMTLPNVALVSDSMSLSFQHF